MNSKFLNGSWFVIILTVIGLSLFLSSYYTIQTGTVGVLSTFGKFSTEEKEPGLHFKVPLFQSVHIFDVKLQTVNYHGNRMNLISLASLINRKLPYLMIKILPLAWILQFSLHRIKPG